MTPLELVERLSEGMSLSADELDTFLAGNPKEGQHLDYKSGMLADDGQGSVKLRRHVAGMANAVGGALIIRVRDDRSVDGISAGGGRGWRGWAENCVAPMTGWRQMHGSALGRTESRKMEAEMRGLRWIRNRCPLFVRDAASVA